MKRWITFILLVLAASVFAYAPERLLGTTLENSQLSTLNSHQHIYLTGGQRATQARTDGNSVSYTHDAIGQLTQALGSGGQSTQTRGFDYDAAWNFAP